MGLRGAVGSIAGIREQTNQDSWLKNKVLRTPPAVSEPSVELIKGDCGEDSFVVSRGITFCTRDEVCANHLTACGGNAILFSLFLTENQRERNIFQR